MPAQNTAIMTVAIGAEFRKLGQLTHPLMLAYAEKIDSDFIAITAARSEGVSPLLAKLEIARCLEIFDRILFLDTDIIVTSGAYNLFEVVQEDSIGAHLVSEHVTHHDRSIERFQKTLGDIGWHRTYFNAGVMVLSKQHKAIFSPAEYIDEFAEQTLLNYRVQKLKVPIHDIGWVNNHTCDAHRNDDRFSSNFIHYAGPGHTPGKDRLEQIRDDIDRLERLGGLTR